MLGVSMRLPEPIDLAPPLRAYIQSNYTAEELSSVSAAIATTASLRTRVHGSIVRNESDSDATIALYLSYYANLLSLQQHFPFGNTPSPSTLSQLNPFAAPKQATVRVCFTWYDSFRHTAKVSDYDIGFELNSVLFDTAALYSRRATAIKGQASAQDDTPIKEACRLFQVSAGLFEHLARSASSSASSGLSVDLSADGLSFLNKLMLAQAQAAFFEKSTYTASPKLVAKLAQAVSELFGDCRRLAGTGRMKALQTGSGSSGGGDVYAWESHCYYQQLCYNAASHYWLAKGLLAEDKYGEEIAHLDKARQLLEAAIKVESSLLKNLAENRMKLDAAIRTRLATAVKENNLIYYASIPPLETLRDSESVITVKSTPFVLSDSVDPYADLLSPLVKQQSEEFRTKLSELVARMGRESREADDYSKMCLSSLGLPAALEAAEGEQGISDELWGAVHTIQYGGGRDGLEAATERIDIAAREAKSAVASVDEELSKEKSEDDAIRRQFGTRWNRRGSEQLTAQFKRDVDIVRKYLAEADKSNGKVRGELERNAGVLEALRQSRQQIDARLPHNTLVSAQSSAAKRESVQQLHALLDQLSALVDERQRATSDMSAASKKHDIAAVLNAAIGKSKSVDVIYAEELGRYDAYKERLAALNAKQDALLSSITSTAQVYSSSLQREQGTSGAQRQAVLQELNDGIRVYEKLLANLNEGLRFYSDLQQQRVQPLRQRVEDFCVARQMEKSLVLEQITSDIASYRGGDDGGGRQQRNGASGGGGGGGGAYAINPNLSYEHADTPMYDFSSVASSLPSLHTAAASPPASTNPFADYQPPAQPASASSYQSNLPSPYAPRPASGAASPHSYQNHPAAPAPYQPAPYQQQPAPAASRPPPPIPPAASQSYGGYPGQYSANPSAARPPPAGAGGVVSCPACTYENAAGAAACDMCATALPPLGAQQPMAAGVPAQRGGGIFGLFGRS